MINFFYSANTQLKTLDENGRFHGQRQMVDRMKDQFLCKHQKNQGRFFLYLPSNIRFFDEFSVQLYIYLIFTWQQNLYLHKFE